MNFRDRVLRDILFQEIERATHRESDMVKAALVRPTRRVADDHRQNIESQKITFRAPQRFGDDESPVAAAEVEHHGGLATEERLPVERARRRQLLDRRPRPLFGRQDHAGDRHPEFGFHFARHQPRGTIRISHDSRSLSSALRRLMTDRRELVEPMERGARIDGVGGRQCAFRQRLAEPRHPEASGRVQHH